MVLGSPPESVDPDMLLSSSAPVTVALPSISPPSSDSITRVRSQGFLPCLKKKGEPRGYQCSIQTYNSIKVSHFHLVPKACVKGKRPEGPTSSSDLPKTFNMRSLRSEGWESLPPFGCSMSMKSSTLTSVSDVGSRLQVSAPSTPHPLQRD